MPDMNEQHIARMEARLEKLVEGLFSHVLGRRIHAYDIARELARAMQTHSRMNPGQESLPIAPDRYIICINPDVADRIQSRYPDLPDILSQQITELAGNASYHLQNVPVIQFIADSTLTGSQLQVRAEHINQAGHTTGVMQPIRIATAQDAPQNAQFVLNSINPIMLTGTLISIGRSLDNDIVLDDPYVSRHHAQVRLRFGYYTLFDTTSQGGTYVNDVQVREHRLQTGDVVRLGSTVLVYMEDDRLDATTTGLMDPV